MSTPLVIDRRDGGAMLTLNRPDKRNARSADLVERAAQSDRRCPYQRRESDRAARFVRIEMLLNMITRSPADKIACALRRSFGTGVDLSRVCEWREI